MPAGGILLAAFSCALGVRFAHAYASQDPPPVMVLSVSQQQAVAASVPAQKPPDAPAPVANLEKDKPSVPAAPKAPEKPGPSAADDAADQGRKMFDGAKSASGGGLGASGSALSGIGAAAASATSGAGKPPAAKADVEMPPPAKGLVVPEIPGPVKVEVPSAPNAGDSAWWSEWTGSVKRWAGEAWKGIQQTVTDLAKEMFSLFERLGEGFKNAFMRVWSAPDTISFGSVNRGRLANGIQMPSLQTWQVRNPVETFGSKHMVLGLMYIGGQITAQGGPAMRVGDISDRNGGQLNRHKSHQNGLDVDIYFFYANGRHDTLWNYRILQGLCKNPYFESTIIFVSPRVKRMLLLEARRQGDAALAGWAVRILNTGEPGHDDHFHVRISPQPKQPVGPESPAKI